jgi:hypothetical protein
MTCTATFGNGARIGTEIIRKKTWLIRKGQKKVLAVCCVAARGTLILGIAALPFVTGMSLASVTTSSVAASVSPTIEFPTARNLQNRLPQVFFAHQWDTEKRRVMKPRLALWLAHHSSMRPWRLLR